MLKEEKELCLDCRSQAAGHVLKQCHLHGHEATIVVYSDAEMREIVSVYWPMIASNVRRFTVKADHLETCQDCMKCSFPHHYLEGKILNLWRENSVMTDTRPSPVRVPDSLHLIESISYLICIHIPAVMVPGRIEAGDNSICKGELLRT